MGTDVGSAPRLSVFFENGAFFDLGVGVNTLLTPGAEVGITGDQIEDIQDPEVADLLQQAQDEFAYELERGANSITADISAFPTVFVGAS